MTEEVKGGEEGKDVVRCTRKGGEWNKYCRIGEVGEIRGEGE